MAISLETEGARIPSIKLRNIGDHVDFHVVKVEQVPRTEFGTNNPMIGDDGKPKMQERVTIVVTGGAGVISEVDGDNRRDVPAPLDEPLAMYLASYDRWEWYQAKNELSGGLDVGDKGRWKYERDEPSQHAGNNDRKVRSLILRKANSDEQSVVARCEELYHQLADQGARIPTDEPAPMAAVDDGDPF